MRERRDPWWSTTKSTDDFLDPLFEDFFRKVGLPNLMRKSDYHRLAALVSRDLIDPEITEKLDAIVAIAARARRARIRVRSGQRPLPPLATGQRLLPRTEKVTHDPRFWITDKAIVYFALS